MPKEAVSLETTSGSGMKNNDLTFAMEKIGVHTIRKQKYPFGWTFVKPRVSRRGTSFQHFVMLVRNGASLFRETT